MEGFGRGARRHLEGKAPRKLSALQFTSEGGGGARMQTYHLLPSEIMEGRAVSWGRGFGLKMEKFWRWTVTTAARHCE